MAAQDSPFLKDSFPIGTGEALCEGQDSVFRAQRGSIFDRKWALLCRDAPVAIGTIYMLRGDADAARIVIADRRESLDCSEPVLTRLGDLPMDAELRSCRGAENALEWRSYQVRDGDRLYVAEGLASYDSVTTIALRTLVLGRQLPDQVSIATVATSDLSTMQRAQAAASDPDMAIGQGYRRNSAGLYAEAAEFFRTSLDEPDDGVRKPISANEARRQHERKVNLALQLSNLGEFDEANLLFAEAREMAITDPVQVRLARNFEAIHALNLNEPALALANLDREVPAIQATVRREEGATVIDAGTARSLNSDTQLVALLGQPTRLTPAERATILDAQSDQLRGTVYRLTGRQAEAATALTAAEARLASIRDGRVTSTTRLRAQILSERALVAERQGRVDESEKLLREALGLVATRYPASSSLNGARARLGAFLIRHGKNDAAIALYRQIVEEVTAEGGSLIGFSNQMRPYFRLLAELIPTQPGLTKDLFLASQLIARPGAAETMATLTRELQAGDDKAASLFRQSVSLSRDIERNRIATANLTVEAQSNPAAADRLAQLATERSDLLRQQVAVLDQLQEFPAYRAVSNGYISQDDLQALLKSDEAYYKLTNVGGDLYASYITPSSASGWRLPVDADALSDSVAIIRDSISVSINNVRSTFPFDVDASRELTGVLLAEGQVDLSGVDHLVFEPDGALLQLPPNLLILDDKGVEEYHRKVAAGGDPFDFTGVAWLGRDVAISTSLSAASFREARKVAASQAKNIYLGMGENEPLGARLENASVRGVAGGTDCAWPARAWNQPISSAELNQAASLLGPSSSAILTGEEFSDSRIKSLDTLDDYKILHFATHGLVTPPQTQCPARPALITSFGGAGSDGLLQFDEIFDLRLDADMVILSACDTAGQASLEATRSAGIRSGGGQALDGLVRAFIGAGGRLVIASHWPAPDGYDATGRLFSSLFTDRKNESVAMAMKRAERALMDDPLTSHPFYWSGFAVVGDGGRNLPTGD